MPDHNSDHNPAIPHTRTPILVAAIAEAGNRLSELEAQLAQAQHGIGEGITRPHDGPERCPTYCDGCNCTVKALVHNIKRAKRAERRVAELEREHEEDQVVIRAWCGRTKRADARVAELEEGISTAMQLIEGGFDSAAYEALEALNAHK